MKRTHKVKGWIVDRFGLKPIHDNALDRRVPKTPWYFGDGSTLFLLLCVLIATGALMTLTYSPSPEAAYESVRYITEVQVMGWFIRGLHYWSAGMMVVVTVIHLFRQIALGGYKFPREGTWLIGVVLLFLVMVMSFSGYVLRWDERGLYAVHVLVYMVSRVPFIGEALAQVIQGGPEIGARTLTRIYSVHVILVPLSLIFLTGFHIYLVMFHGTITPTERGRLVHSAEEQRQIYHEDAHSQERGETFYPSTTLKSGLMAFSIFLFVVTLAVFAGPGDLYPPASWTSTTVPAEEWWFWWYSALAALLPPWLAPVFYVVFPLAVFLLLVALPFLDRGPHRGVKKRPFGLIFVVAATIALLVLTELRTRSPWTAWPTSVPPPVPAGVQLSPEAEEGRLLFARYGCNSCHSVGGVGRDVAVDLAAVAERLSHAELRSYILQPPEGVAMPSYRGHLTESELERLVAFVLAAQTFPPGN